MIDMTPINKESNLPRTLSIPTYSYPEASIGRSAAAYVIALPGHKRTIPAGKKVNYRRNFFRCPGPFHGNAIYHIFHLLCGQLLKDLRPNYRRCDSIYADTFRRYFLGNRLGHSDDCRLRCGVSHHVRVTLFAGYRGDVDNAAKFLRA